MALALGWYAAWLETLALQGKVEASGAVRVSAIRAIQRASFTDASSLMAALLLGHEQIATAMFNCRLGELRSGGSGNNASDETAALAQRQLATVAGLRACCEHSSSAAEALATARGNRLAAPGARDERPSEGSPGG